MLASPAQLKALNPIHVLRGAQLAWLGVYRAAQNPRLYENDHYKLLGVSVMIGILLHLLLQVPFYLARCWIALASFVYEKPLWEDTLYAAIHFLQHWIISVPFLLLNYFRSVKPETFDSLFLESMRWVDHIYTQKHAGESKANLRKFYITTLEAYGPIYQNDFYNRTGKRVLFGLLLYMGSYLPRVGQFILPAFSFFTLNRAIGVIPAFMFFSAATLLLPRHFFVVLLQTYFSTRSLTRQLLLPYFARVGGGFTTYQKAKWYREREGVLFGFALPFFLLMRIPYIGVLSYGIASSSAAFLVSKITHPPPHNHEKLEVYASKEMFWTQGRKNLVKSSWDKLQDLDDSHWRKVTVASERKENEETLQTSEDPILRKY